MADPTHIDALLQAAVCYNHCIPPGMMAAVKTKLLLDISVLNLTPEQLMQRAVCYDRCIPPGMQAEVHSMMLESILTGLNP